MITQVHAHNFKGIIDVTIDTARTTITLCGDNGQGKSSVLDAIWAALGGAKGAPERPLRDGEVQGDASVTLEDMTVRRRWWRKKDGGIGSDLEVKALDGRVVSSPQAVLDALIGTLAFDPEAFCRENVAKQAQILRDLSGLDTRDLDDERQRVFAQRTEVGREVRRLAAELDGMAETPTPGARVDLVSLFAQQDAAVAAQRAFDGTAQAIERARLAQHSAQGKVSQLTADLAAAQESLATATRALAEAETDRDLSPEPPDLGALKAQILAATEANRALDRIEGDARRRAGLKATLATSTAKQETLTQRIDAIDAEAAARTKAAKMPLEGLTFGAEGVHWRGIPLAQASSAEKLRIGAAVGFAANPRLPCVQVRAASLLDDASLTMLSDMASERGGQVFLERVGRVEGAIRIVAGSVDEESC